MTRNSHKKIAFNLAFSEVLKKLGYAVLADAIKERQSSVYTDWEKCNDAQKSIFFRSLGNGSTAYSMRYYDKRVLDDLFERGHSAIFNYAKSKAERIQQEVKKRRGGDWGNGVVFEPRNIGFVSPLVSRSYLNEE